RSWLPRPVDEVFPFFADAHNLNVLTPAFLHFEVLTPKPIHMREGLLLDYRIRLRGIPIKWRTRIRSWEPGRRFIDEQISGPYLEWVHTHDFHDVDGGTDVIDSVRYRVLGGALVNALIVERDVRSIFDFRAQALRRHFDAPPSPRDQPPTVRRLS
ncbi:MAG TPA: SRPBCC family protein, partial [Luteitalea sp.]|nr:SRPBCC family protein [Luteitalea sp.]